MARHLAARGVPRPTLAEVRETVLAIRRTKSMVLDPDDPNRRSCGSFFLNPIVEPAQAEAVDGARRRSRHAALAAGGRAREALRRVAHRARRLHARRRGRARSASRRATRSPSCAHAGARTRDVLALARRVEDTVETRFGLRLTREPVLWGLV